MEPVDTADDDMIVFRGKLHFNPSTLNNQIVTYFLAHALQKDPNYKYEQWEKLIHGVAQLNKDYKQRPPELPFDKIIPPADSKTQWSFQLFNDWSVYGDGTAFPDFTVIAVYDSTKFNPLVTGSQHSPEIGKKVCAEIGSHKGSIADQDTDNQLMSKWFSNSLVLMNAVNLTMLPVSFTNMHRRVLNMPANNRAQSYCADWYAGQASLSLKPKGDPLSAYPVLQRMFKKVTESSRSNVKYKFAFRANQYRYNTTSKESQVVGYLELIRQTVQPVQIANWRCVSTLLSRTEGGGPVWFKQTKKGMLIDLSSVMKDLCLTDGLPHYPESITISNLSGLLSYQITDCQRLMEEKGGLVFIPGVNSFFPKDSALAVYGKSKILFKFADHPDLYPVEDKGKFVKPPLSYECDMYEIEFQSSIVEPFRKNKLLSFEYEEYEPSIQYDVFCKRYGKPFTGERKFTLKACDYAVIKTASNYLDLGVVRSNLQKLIDTGKPPYAGRTVDQLIDQYFGGSAILQKINEVAKHTMKTHIMKGKSWSYRVNPNNPNCTEAWELQFKETKSKQLVVSFKDGKGSYEVEPNFELTSDVNPRRDVMDSLCLSGFLQDTSARCSTLFTSLFFENPSRKPNRDPKEPDWVNYVGPKLRVMAMMYPAMQRLANLYELKVSMQAMRRVFSVEDENNPRYMPSTREMSPTVHRNIWRWLFLGRYNSTTVQTGWSIIEVERTVQSGGKFIDKLHDAFRLEFGTIPLYLMAMYSVMPGSNSEKIFREIFTDEMKHLCIVSNLISALGGRPDFMGNIPAYPLTLPGVFQYPQDKELAEQFTLGPCSPKQLRKFIMIEYPSQVNNIQFCVEGLTVESQQRMRELQQYLNRIKSEFDKSRKFRSIGMFYGEIMEDLWMYYDLYRDEPAKMFKGNIRRQFTYFMDGLTPIYDIKTALEQLKLIVDEGEGSHVFDMYGDLNKKSHFFKLIELYTGCRVDHIETEIPDGDYNKQFFRIFFTDKGVPYEMSNIEKCWDETQINRLKDKRRLEDKVERVMKSEFPNLYADSAFQGAFRSLVADLHEVFGDDPSPNESEQIYQQRRLSKFENSVSKMKQMSMLGRQLLRPNLDQLGNKVVQGIPPNFNIVAPKPQPQQAVPRSNTGEQNLPQPSIPIEPLDPPPYQ